MRNIKFSNAAVLKQAIKPADYYSQVIGGSLGRHTGNGWHIWNGLCPFHVDKKPGSFYINRVTGAFKCFSCGAGGGDILAFHMQRTGCSFPEAIERVGGLQCGGK